MERDEFLREISRVAASFDKTLKPGLVEEYYSALSKVNDRDLPELFRWAKTELEKFPPISVLLGHARSLGYLTGVSRREVKDGVVVVECKCGGSFAVTVKDIERDEKSFQCMTPECVWRYDAAIIKANLVNGTATFGGTYAGLRRAIE